MRRDAPLLRAEGPEPRERSPDRRSGHSGRVSFIPHDPPTTCSRTGSQACPLAHARGSDGNDPLPRAAQTVELTTPPEEVAVRHSGSVFTMSVPFRPDRVPVFSARPQARKTLNEPLPPEPVESARQPPHDPTRSHALGRKVPPPRSHPHRRPARPAGQVHRRGLPDRPPRLAVPGLLRRILRAPQVQPRRRHQGSRLERLRQDGSALRQEVPGRDERHRLSGDGPERRRWTGPASGPWSKPASPAAGSRS